MVCSVLQIRRLVLTSIEEFGEIFSSVNGIVKMENSGGKELIQIADRLFKTPAILKGRKRETSLEICRINLCVTVAQHVPKHVPKPHWKVS